MTEEETRRDERRKLRERIGQMLQSKSSYTSSAYTGTFGQDAALEKFAGVVLQHLEGSGT